MMRFILMILFMAPFILNGQIERNILRDSVVNVQIDSLAQFWLFTMNFYDGELVTPADTQYVIGPDSITVIDSIITPEIRDTTYSSFRKTFQTKDNMSSYVSDLFQIFQDEVVAANRAIENAQTRKDNADNSLLDAIKDRQKAIRQRDAALQLLQNALGN